jgi:chromosome segregation ATPase
VKKKGQILTLTAREALDAGLSNATVPDIAAVRDVLGLKAWHNAGNSPAQLMTSRSKNHAKDVAARDDKLKSLKPELAEIDARLRAVADRASAAEAEVLNLRARFNTEIAAMEAEYHRDMDAARSRGGAAPFQTKQATRDKVLAMRKRYEAEIAKQEAIAQAALAEGRQLLVKRSQAITAALPSN